MTAFRENTRGSLRATGLSARRRGACLHDGAAHAHDHARHSRRDFLARMGLATAGVAFSAAGLPISAFGHAPTLRHLGALETDRVLVLIQMRGGNDGLNMVVPIANDIYYRERPTIAIPPAAALRLDAETGLHPAMQSLLAHWGDGRMGVVHNTGYDSSTRSHFEGTVNWLTGRGQGEAVGTGWTGRYLADQYYTGPETVVDHPLAVRVGNVPATLFQSEYGNLGVTFADSQQFERFLSQGGFYDPADVAPTVYGEALAFVRSVTNASFRYVEAVQRAADAAENQANYPGSGLSESLAVVARLIRGRLGARVFAVSEGGFDTHSNQGSVEGTHANNLRGIADAVAAFLSDLAADGLDQNVLVMTFSEFGRTLTENGSGGTDHGAGSPLLLFGGGLRGGLFGTLSTLRAPDLYGGDPRFTTDYRTVYATILRDWFGLPPDHVAELLGGDFGTLDFVETKINVAREDPAVPATFRLEQNYPNPFNPQTTISFALERGAAVRLRVYDVQGRHVRTLLDAPLAPGAYTVPFDARDLPSGTYLYRLETSSGTASRRMVLLR